MPTTRQAPAFDLAMISGNRHIAGKRALFQSPWSHSSMSRLAETDILFFERAGLDRDRTQRLVADALAGSDDGELFLEYRLSEAISVDDGRVKSASYDAAQGFGLRAISGEAQGYAHASELSEPALKRA